MADKIAAIQGRSDRRSRVGVAKKYIDLGDGSEAESAVAPPGNPASSSLVPLTLSATTTAAPLEASPGTSVADICLENDPASTHNVLVGSATDQTAFTLVPGEQRWLSEMGVQAINTAQVYVKAASGTATVNALARSASGGAVTSLGATPTALSSIACDEVLVWADIGNSANVLVGNSSHQYTNLAPGQTLRIKASNANKVYVVASGVATGLVVYYQARTNLAPAGGSTTIGAATVADGADVAEGATTDAAVYGDTAGTVEAKLRGINNAVLSPTVFKTAAATASGDTAVWTPTSGKKFQLQRVLIQVTADAVQASGGDLAIALRDATSAIGITLSVFVPASAGTTMAGAFCSPWIDLGTGIRSALANNVLNVNLSAALTGGAVRVVACGIEI